MVQYVHSNNNLASLRTLAISAILLVTSTVHADDAAEQFFETKVRPLLIEKCVGCHGAEKVSGGLRVDSLQSLIEGGDSGAAIVPGDVSGSLLIQAVRRDGDLAMPPKKELTADEIGMLGRWIEMGAPWPATDQQIAAAQSNAAEKHWAFQSVRRPRIPDVANEAWVRTPVDAFVMAKLEQNHLDASPAADRRALIRAVSYSLTGLPPAPADVDLFVADTNPDAYQRLVQRVLDSPQYGQHWARHWLDVARYSDTKGYVYAREERHWVHAWTYRDWVAKALNDDMPYDRFLLLQLAADQVDDRRQEDLAAMGFLTLGRRFLGVKRDIIDDRIDVVCRGTMGLTVACARCHDHKYDPIPTADYYSLYGVFDSCVEQLVALESSDNQQQEFEAELAKRKAQLQAKLAASRQESSARARQRVADYLFAQSELHKFPANGFDQVFENDDLLPAFVRQWERYLRKAKQSGDPIFAAWHAFAEIPSQSFAEQSPEVTSRLRTASPGAIDPIVCQAFSEPPKSFREVCDRYGELLADKLRTVLDDPNSPSQVPEGPIVETETFFTTATLTELWKLQGEVDRWIINSEVPAAHAVTLIDQPTPSDPRIFVRGNPINQGIDVPRQFLSLLAGATRQPFQHGSGRLELAREIVDPGNPLTARVIVNRVWAYHFGSGLVSTPSDFGTRAAPPSHPELLDWLASEFIAQGWSLKYLHRLIVLSATYRQSTSGPTDPDVRARAIQTDPHNRLLWKTNARRLSFEELRDTLLAVTGELDETIGGKPSELFNSPYPKRRTLYGLVDRQYLPGMLRVFDFANPDLHTPQRTETTVPQQALFFMNHPLVLERVKALAQLANANPDPQQRVVTMFRQALQRAPTDREIADAISLVQAASGTEPAVPAKSADWQYGYGTVDQTAQSVSGFTPLPHFTGTAWQGGPNWPDEQLGWVQLTATGGHPGNDLTHAAIRRWTAPRDLTISIRSELVHQPSAGDGVRAMVVSSQHGMVDSTTIHQGTKELNAESLTVAKGEVIDFVVDIGEVLNSDQYLWKVTIQSTHNKEDSISWNSVEDFPTGAIDRLDPWEQLAQVLLCTNEFMFVD